MSWLEEILDYSKSTLKVLGENKIIFVPYIGLLVLKVLVLLAFFFTGSTVAQKYVTGALNVEDLFSYTSFLPLLILFLLLIGLIYLAIQSFLEAGIASMLMLALKKEKVMLSDFWQGGKYFFARFLGGTLLIYAVGLVLSPLLLILYIIVGILTLGLGFIILPLLAGVFLGMWQVALVTNDSDIIASVKNSFQFGKEFFWPFLFVNFIQAILKGSFSLGGGDKRSIQDQLVTEEITKIPSFFLQQGLTWIIGLGGAIFGVIFIITSLIKLAFDVFFRGFYFIFYMDKRAKI